MTRPLTASDRLSPQHPDPDAPKRGRTPRKPRRGGGFGRLLGRLFGLLLGGAVVVAIVAGMIGFAFYQRVAADLPTVDGLRQYQPQVLSRVYADDGQLIGELAEQRRIFVPLTAIPDVVKSAFISAEDQNFWTHHGVDPVAILRAAVFDLQQMGQGRRPIGASTITQQVAKNMLLGSNAVSLTRKAREALLAMRIEQTLSKDRILELYLNEIYLGLSSYGVAAAAQAYFNKPLDELTIAQAAFLGALPKAPNNYNPFRFPDAAKSRRDWVIDRMADDHAITPEQAQLAKAEPIDPSPYSRPQMAIGSSWFSEEVRRQLVDHFGAEMVTTGGLQVQTSLDPRLQLAADHALRAGLMAYDRSHGGWRGPVARLEAGAALRTHWETDLAQVAPPPGMLRNWILAEVLDAGDHDAHLGWMDRPADQPNAPATPHIGTMLLADSNWARAAHAGHIVGGTPRHMAELLHPGDVVMAELLPAEPAAGHNPGRPERLALRQIPLVEGALVSLDPVTGRVLAMSGGWSSGLSQFNRSTQAERQPGSSFKPMVYLTALEHGVSPSQRFLDAPFVLNMGAAGEWRPGNYENTFSGPTPLRIALEKSLNLVTIRVAASVGMDAVAKTAEAFHVVDSMPLVLPAALGAVDTTVLRQAGAYASLAQGGREVLPTMVDSVQDRDGHVIWRAPGLVCQNCTDPTHPPQLADQRKQIADPQSVFQLVTMMQGVVTRGTGVKAAAGLNRIIAGKTGTSQDFNDAWFVGFTPDVVTAVWVGFDQPQSLGEGQTGGDVAGPIWHDYMAVALKGGANLAFTQPDGVTLASWDSGYGMVTDAFKPGQVPGASSDSLSADDSANTGAPAAPGSGTTGASLDTGMGGLY